MGVKFELFGRLKKRSPQKTYSPHYLATYSTSVVDAKDVNSAKAIAQKLLKQGKTEEEVRMHLKEKGFDFREIEDALAYVLREKVSEGSTPKKPPTLSPLYSSQPSTPSTTHSPPSSSFAAEDNEEDIFLQEIEELVNMVIEARYSKLTSLPQQFHELKEEVMKLTSKLEEKESKEVEQIKDKLDSMEEALKEHTKMLEDLEPRLNALENAFKDTLPQIIDDLRRIEERLHIEQKEQIKDTKVFSLSSSSPSPSQTEQQSQKEEEQKDQQASKQNEQKEVEIKEEELPFKLDDLIS